ncbi:LysR family transcriptional regulator [Photobacterium atrarenae]|uniref:LysR family transcriptional regulator n=1 Tax=Photobacterium atrarenae TaxID=865757 RepID=A0ABY5GHS6_9GAMM|nr:LysR family transcriptional regulator [Photobacterium atrarenae]UTV28838.1 LysR family transcriptional regulator [Photobacterium atrarenae]
MDKLTAARVFIDVARSGSFTATAARLEMSRSMVTRYIEAMENWLQARLLQRTTRKVTLTDAGLRCLTQAQAWVEMAEDMQFLHQPDNQLSGKLRLTTSMSFGHAQLMPAIHDFMARHPSIEVDIDVADRTVNLVEEQVDLAIRIAANPDPTLVGRPIARCKSILVASPAYLQQHAPIRQPSDLLDHQCLGYKNFEHHVWHLSQGDQHVSTDIHCRLTANEATVLLSAALAGHGIAMQPTYLANSYLKSEQLVQVLPTWQPKVMSVYALYPSRKHLAPGVRALIDHLVEYYKANPW